MTHPHQRGPDSRYLLDFDTRDLARYTTDLLVVGGGVAGLSAALAAAPGARVLLVRKTRGRGTNTGIAQGGIAAAWNAADEPARHAADTERVGSGLCDPEVVAAVTESAPAAISRLIELGAQFDRDGEELHLGQEGGHRERRIVSAGGDATGRECMRVLESAAEATPAIRTWDDAFLIDLLTLDGRCVGALLERAGEPAVVMARAVLLAAGGAGRLYRETSNVASATGDGIAAAYRAGALLRDLEFVQFHPTTLYLAGSPRLLITEAVRGEGARLVDNLGRRFLEATHEDGDLAPRDVVSRAIVEHLGRPGVEDVYLDFTHLATAKSTERFAGLASVCQRYGLDLTRDRVPVRPAAHYFIGGVATDLDGFSSLPGLFACGEASCTGLHGANRLASNSLLEGLVLGDRAGRAAQRENTPLFQGQIGTPTRRRGGTLHDLADLRRSLASLMWRRVGIQRDAAGLESAIESIDQWWGFLDAVGPTGREGLELANLLELAGLVARAALARQESRGTHFRLDFPQASESVARSHYNMQRGHEPFFEAASEPVRSKSSGSESNTGSE
ncbi:MAG: L-aspartate oxidase [Planctomycetota bacterium]